MNQQYSPFSDPRYSSAPMMYQGQHQYVNGQPMPPNMGGPGAPQPAKKRKPHGCLWGLLKFLIVVAATILVIFGILKVREYLALRELREEFKESVPTWDVSEEIADYILGLENVHSDISGMSVEDKINAGYIPEDGSDTDRDGLTDQEELEVYGTDPLNPSTAGDGIQDGLKVSNGLNPTESFNPAEVAGTYAQMYPNISFKNVETSANVVLEEIEGYTYSGTPVARAYSITGCNDSVTIDFSQDISGQDYFIFKKSDSINADYELLKDKDGVVIVKSDGEGFVVGCVPLPKTSFNAEGLGDVPTSSTAWFAVYPVTAFSGKMQVHVVEQDLFGTKKDRSEEMMQYFISVDPSLADSVEIHHDRVDPFTFAFVSTLFNLFYENTFTDMVYDEVRQIDASADTEESRSIFQIIINFFIIVTKMEPSEWEDLLEQAPVENPEDTEMEEPAQRPSELITSFDVDKDGFTFANVGTFVSPGGNCAGMALIVSEVFSEKYPLASDVIVDSEEGTEYPYDISGVEECSTFFNRYLNDYKYYSFWKDTYPDGLMNPDSLAENDRKFLEFLGAKWAYWNDLDQDIHFFNSEIPWSDMESLMDYMRANDEVLVLGMSSGGSGHAINLYGFEPDPDNPNVWYALVYDNNFPNNKWNDRPVDNRVKLIKKDPLFGDPYFEFDYYPLPDIAPDYRYTSLFNVDFSDGKHALISAFQAHMFVVTNTEKSILID